MTEIWKEIKGTDGRYMVSSYGRVKNATTGMILKQRTNYKGYNLVGLGKGDTKVVHRLVAEAFIPNPDGKPCVDHINTVRDDNRVENLRWVTYSENNNNPLTLPRMIRDQGKPIIQLSLTGQTLAYYPYMNDAERKTNVLRKCISKCVLGQRKTSGGYRWLSYDDWEKFY